MELKFDNKRYRVKYCPCNKSNKDGKFVPYENQVKYGYCHSCDKTYLPKKNNTVEKYIPPIRNKKVDVINKDLVIDSLNEYHINHFAIFLKQMFEFKADELIKRFRLGTTKKNGVIFWQIDEQLRTRTGKIMAYNPNTGKRRQDIFPTWIHKILNQTYQQCLYGLHQLKTMPGNQDIHIVESEKTAIVMTFFFPHIIWLASGGSNGLQSFKFEALRGRNVCLFPDHSKYELWNNQMERLKFEHPSIKFYPTSIDCEVWYENNEIEKGEDIADYHLMNHKIYG